MEIEEHEDEEAEERRREDIILLAASRRLYDPVMCVGVFNVCVVKKRDGGWYIYKKTHCRTRGSMMAPGKVEGGKRSSARRRSI